MKIILLDGEKINNIEELHDAFAASLMLPVWYGRNLDALHDILCERYDEIGIIAVNTDMISEKLGRKWCGFMRMIGDVLKERRNVHFCADPFAE